MNLPALLIFALLCFGLFKDLSFLLYLLFILPVFGALALLPPSMLGDVTLLPASFAALLLIIKAFCYPSTWQGTTRAMLDVRQMGLLCLFLIIAVAGAFILPRVFEGVVTVCPIRIPSGRYLGPSGANFTQPAYLLLSSFTGIVLSVLIRKPGMLDVLLKAILWGGYAVIATGLLDIFAFAFGFSSVLTYFQTASYAFMTENYVMGARRIIGLMSEASSFGMLAASYGALLLFLRPAYPADVPRIKVTITMAGCLVMACLSTSSTAFVMLGVTMLLYLAYQIHRITPEGITVKKTVFSKLLFLLSLVIAVFLIAIVKSDWALYVIKLLDNSLLEKVHTTSYIERSRWNSVALDAFAGTHGIGVGVGSVRTSDFFINILASTGILGSVIFGLFLTLLFLKKASTSDVRGTAVITALKFSLLPLFAGFALAGTTPDFGLTQGAIFGMIVGLASRSKIADSA